MPSPDPTMDLCRRGTDECTVRGVSSSSARSRWLRRAGGDGKEEGRKAPMYCSSSKESLPSSFLPLAFYIMMSFTPRWAGERGERRKGLSPFLLGRLPSSVREKGEKYSCAAKALQLPFAFLLQSSVLFHSASHTGLGRGAERDSTLIHYFFYQWKDISNAQAQLLSFFLVVGESLLSSRALPRLNGPRRRFCKDLPSFSSLCQGRRRQKKEAARERPTKRDRQRTNERTHRKRPSSSQCHGGGGG